MDVSTAAQQWTKSATLSALDPSQRSLAVQLAITGVDDLDMLKSDIAAAVQLIAPTLNSESPLRDQLVDQLGPVVAECLNACASAEDVSTLIANIKGAHHDTHERLDASSVLADTLATADLGILGEVLYLAGEASAEFAARLLELAGGENAVLGRIRDQEPLLLEAERRSAPDGDVAYGRLLHIHDRITPDTSENTRRVAKLLVRCLPGTVRADVETQIAQRQPLELNGTNFNVSGLLRRYALTTHDIEWNRNQSLIALHTLGTLTPTERASKAVEVLEQLAAFADDLFSVWITKGGEGAISAAALEERRRELLAAGALLTVPVEQIQLIPRELRDSAVAAVTDMNDGQVDPKPRTTNSPRSSTASASSSRTTWSRSPIHGSPAIFAARSFRHSTR